VDAAKPDGGAAPAAEKPKEEVKEEPKAEVKKEEPAPAPKAEAAKTETYAAQTPSPAAKKILDEKGISPSQVSGSGRDGRITKDDAATASVPAMGSAPAGGNRGQATTKLSVLRRKIAARLVSVKNETAMLTTFNEVDMSEIFRIRKQYKEEFAAKHGIGLGFMSFFTKAVTRALKLYPDVNASLRGVEANIKDLAVKVRDGKISVDEMTGGTFTITNGGTFGSMMSTPIINPPQSAILGMHNILQRPMAIDGQVVIRPMMYVALSYDHRIIDGKESVGFLVAVKEAIDNPVEFLMDGDERKALEL